MSKVALPSMQRLATRIIPHDVWLVPNLVWRYTADYSIEFMFSIHAQGIDDLLVAARSRHIQAVFACLSPLVTRQGSGSRLCMMLNSQYSFGFTLEPLHGAYYFAIALPLSWNGYQ